jgi:hypothetical protein
MTSLRNAIETYIRSKDGNRPHVLADAFAADAELAMAVNTSRMARGRTRECSFSPTRAA